MAKNAEMKDVLTAIFDGILKSEEEEIKANFGGSIDELMQKHQEQLKDAEYFDVIINLKLDDIMESVIQNMYPEFDQERFYLLFFLYRHYNFFENTLEELIRKKEGLACCSDKTRWLLNSYKKYLFDNSIPDMEIGEKCFWKPHFGTGQQWIDLCNSLINLYHGKPVDYLKAIFALETT